MKKELFRNFDTNRLVFEDMPEGDAAPAAAEGGDAAPAADAPATCPNCGGEMSEGHTCPAPAADAPAEGGDAAPAADAPAEGGDAAPAADAPAEGEGEMHPAAPEAPATEAPKEEKKGFFAGLFGKK